jgi:hypothetical protein
MHHTYILVLMGSKVKNNRENSPGSRRRSKPTAIAKSALCDRHGQDLLAGKGAPGNNKGPCRGPLFGSTEDDLSLLDHKPGGEPLAARDFRDVVKHFSELLVVGVQELRFSLLIQEGGHE